LTKKNKQKSDPREPGFKFTPQGCGVIHREWRSVEDPAMRGGTGLSMLKSKTTAPRAIVEPLPIWLMSLPVRGPIIIPTM